MSNQNPDFKNSIVTVKDKAGRFLTVSKEGLQDALDEGYTIPSNEEIQHEINLRAESKSTLGAIRAFGEEALGTATFGLSREIANKTGITTPEEQALVKEAHPVAAGLGTTTAIVAPLIATFGASAPLAAAEVGGVAAEAAGAATAAKAGTSIASALNPMAAVSSMGESITSAVAPKVAGLVSGLAETSPRVANAIVRGVSGATGLGAEGAVYGLGNQISEHALGDPEALGEHLMSGIGMGAALGGGLGAIFHGGMGFLERPGAKIAKPIINTAADIQESLGKPITTFEDAVKNATFDNPEERKTIIDNLRNLKPHASQIESAAADLGVPAFPGQLSANDAVQKMWQVLSESPTALGQAEKQKILDSLGVVQKRVEDVIKASSTASRAEVGQTLADSFLEKAQKMIDSYSAKFKELNLTESAIPVNERSIAQIARNIRRIKTVQQGGAPQFAEALQARLANVKTLEDLTEQIKIINNDMKVMSNAIGGDPNAARVAGIVKDKLERLYEVTIKRQFSPRDQKFLLDTYKASRKEFAQAANKLGRIAGVTGAKNIGSPINFVRMLQNEGKFNADVLVDKLFQKKNSKFLEFFQKEFPEEWEMVKNYQKSQIGDYKDGILNVNGVLRTYEKMEPEVQKALFNEQQRRVLDATKTYMEAFPKPINPSGSAHTLGWMGFLTKPIESALETVRDLAFKAGLGGLELSAKEAPRANALSSIRNYASKTEKAVRSGAAAVFSKPVLRATLRGGVEMMDGKEYKKTIKKIDESLANPDQFHSMLDKSTVNLHEYAPQTAFAVQQKMVVAAGFLASKAPRGTQTSVLSKPYEPSKSEVMKFARYYNMVEKPTSILQKIKIGQVLPEEMETLKVVYPQMLQQMQGIVMEELADHMAAGKDLPYQVKIGLSQFLETPLTNSLKQQSIAANQATFAVPSMQREQGLKPTQKGLASLDASGRFQTGYKKLSAGGEA
jgi:hypothetical protein